MAYSDFTLEQAIDQFELTVETLTFQLQPVDSTPELDVALQRYLPLATSISTEKARNELIVTPILLAVRSYFHDQLGYFSGARLKWWGLNGSTPVRDRRTQFMVRSPQAQTGSS